MKKSKPIPQSAPTTPDKSTIDWEKYYIGSLKDDIDKALMEQLKKSALLPAPATPILPISKKISQIEIIEKLDTLYKRILSYEKNYDWEVRALDIYYIGYCRGIVEEAKTLPKEDMLKLNKLWIKYKK